MKRLLLVLLVTTVILSVGCAKAQPEVTAEITPLEVPTPIIADITTQDAFTLIQSNEDNPDFVIIDVRTPQEFATGHIENAINLDYRSETFQEELNSLDKDKTYLVYCGVGSRSASALDIMGVLGFMEAYNMLGGIEQWQKDERPITGG